MYVCMYIKVLSCWRERESTHQRGDEMETDEVKVDGEPGVTVAHDFAHDLTPALLHDQLEHRLQRLWHVTVM